ncbi:Alpha/Beta hydrolase protein [Paraphoma chrysanthemicola]|nr:Alpha/Beta hydrolase protein [Paraphoma chrysanthemicola]
MTRTFIKILVCFLNFSLSLCFPVNKTLEPPLNWTMESLAAHDITLSNGETTRYYEGGSKNGVPLIFMHGWPGIAETWKHQLAYFSAQSKYRVIAPDVRGYGDSTAPKNKRAYSTKALSNEYLEFAKRLGIKKAIWVAHDWGCSVTHPLAAHHPELFIAMASLTVPYHTVERGLNYIKTLINRDLYPEDNYEWGQWDYQRYYETNTEESIKSFESDIEKVTKAIFVPRDPDNKEKRSYTATIIRDGGWFGGSPKNLSDLPLNSTVLDESLYANLIEGFKKHGFFPPTAYYLNHDVNSAYTRSEKNRGVLEFPVLYLDAVDDLITTPTLTPKFAEVQAKHTKDLTYKSIEAAHWLQLEKPNEVNEALEIWLKRTL